MNNGNWYLVVSVAPAQIEVIREEIESAIRKVMTKYNLTPRVDQVSSLGKPGISINFVGEVHSHFYASHQ